MWAALLIILWAHEISGNLQGLDQMLLRLDDHLEVADLAPHLGEPHDLLLLPSALHFASPLPLANLATNLVTITNKSHNKTVSVSVFTLPLEDGQHNDFHVPFIRDQPVPPQCNFTFNVVFLPTTIGLVQTEILVRTTLGQLKYHVQGVGVASPFKVVPLVSLVSYAGVNSNAAIIPDITLYNPYEAPLQITEIFSSGGKFYLELPAADGEAVAAPSAAPEDNVTGTFPQQQHQQRLWTIAAYEKRPVIRVRFVGSLVAGNYSAYIRMRVKCPTDHDTDAAEMLLLEDIVLVIPIRMEVRELQPISLYPEKSLIDLGSVLLHEKRPLSINLFTSDSPDIGVTSLSWDSQVAIGEQTTRFRRLLDCSDIVVGEEMHVRLKIECDLEWAEVIRNISQRWEAFMPGSVMHVSGGITVNSTVGPKKSSQIHQIPLFAEVISGTGLELPQNVTVIYPRPDQVSLSIFYLRNNFDTPIVVTGIEVVMRQEKETATDSHHPVFTLVEDYLKSAAVSDFPKVLRPGESWTIAPTTLSLLKAGGGEEGEQEMQKFRGKSTLRSFMACLRIVTNVTEEDINVPLYGYSGRLTKLILSPEVRNVISKVKGVAALQESDIIAEEHAELIDFGSVRLDVEAHKYIALLNDNPVPIELLNWDLPAMDLLMSIFNVGCMNKFDLGQNKEAVMQPDDWCVFSFAALTTIAGKFSGTFKYETTLERNKIPIRIQGNSGTLSLDPTQLVMSNCFPKTICAADISVESTYSEPVLLHNIVSHKETTVHILTKEILPHAVTKVGVMYFNPRMNKMEPRGYTNGYSNQIFDNTNTDGLFVLQRTAISMFRVLQERQFLLPFQLTTDRQVVSSSVSVNFIWPRIIARRHSLADHAVPVGQDYAYNVTLLNPTEESIGFWYFLTDDRFLIMSLTESPLPSSQDPMSRMLATRVLSTDGNKGQQKFVLPPGKFRNITIHVSGKREPGSYASMLVLKNNFTFFEGAWQKVKIVQPQFKFGNRKPFSTTPLLFEVQDQPSACTGGQEQQQHKTVINTRRVFTAKNSGQLPLVIRGMSINAEPCSGYGFVVLNCIPFELAPNETHKIEISFVPDFTVSRIERKIDFHTDGGVDFQYNLVGVVPQVMLDRCSNSVERPWWEASLKKWSLSMLVTMALIVVTVAYFESLKILKDHSDATYRQRGPFQAPLDFKKLAAASRSSVPDVTTKEIAKAPKKKSAPPPVTNLFNNKRFSWFINRSQQPAVAAAAVPCPGQEGQGTVTSASTSNDKKSSTTSKNAMKSSSNSDRSSSATSPAATNHRPVANGIDSSKSGGASAEATNKRQSGSGKKEATAKKSKGKGKASSSSSSLPSKPAETERKVVPKLDADLDRVVEIVERMSPAVFEPTALEQQQQPKKSARNKSPQKADIVTLGSSFVSEHSHNITNPTKEPSPISSTYGKTPGRERKEKQQQQQQQHQVAGKRNQPSRANKVSLFQQMPNENNFASMTDPWTNACRGLFQANAVPEVPVSSSSSSLGNDMNGPVASGPLHYAGGDPSPFGSNLNFNQLPRDVSGLNGGVGIAEQPLAETLNGCAENPLGAIGTIPPVSKNYNWFDAETRSAPIMHQAGGGIGGGGGGAAVYGNGLLNQSASYFNGFGEHTGSNHLMNNNHLQQDYRASYPMDAAMNAHVAGGAYGGSGVGGYGNMANMFESQPRNSRDLYAEYQQQKAELQRLALLLAMNQAQTTPDQQINHHHHHQQQQQPQQHHQAMSQNTHNTSTVNDYLGWDQPLLLQQQQQQQQQRLQLSGRTGPPPGMGPRRTDGASGEPNNNNSGDSSNQYDPFRSIWNQWNQ